MNKAILILVGILLLSCQENYTPKPRGFFKLSFPEKEFKQYAQDCPFTFEFPTYSKIKTLEKDCFLVQSVNLEDAEKFYHLWHLGRLDLS